MKLDLSKKYKWVTGFTMDDKCRWIMIWLNAQTSYFILQYVADIILYMLAPFRFILPAHLADVEHPRTSQFTDDWAVLQRKCQYLQKFWVLKNKTTFWFEYINPTLFWVHYKTCWYPLSKGGRKRGRLCIPCHDWLRPLFCFLLCTILPLLESRN